MQEHSRSINGLPAISICRPGKWGNPYKSKMIADKVWCVYTVARGREIVFSSKRFKSHTLCTKRNLTMFQKLIGEKVMEFPQYLDPLRGHNLACFCKEGDPCHGDVYLELLYGEDNE